MTCPKVGNTVSRTTIEIKETPSPALSIALVGMLQGAAAIALGGVATGRQKAWEQLNATGIIKYKGCHLATFDISASTGSNTLATATLLENSVRTDANIHAMAITANFGSFTRSSKYMAMSSLMPLCLEPSARAKPPPSKKIRPHGSFCWMTFQVTSGGEATLGLLSLFLLKMLRKSGLAGIMKRSITTIKAAVASLT